jgi:hypothetical protein
MDDHEEYQVEKILDIIYKRKPKIPWAVVKWTNWAKSTKVPLTNIEDTVAYNEYLRFQEKRAMLQNNIVLNTCLSMVNIITNIHNCENIVKGEIKEVGS